MGDKLFCRPACSCTQSDPSPAALSNTLLCWDPRWVLACCSRQVCFAFKPGQCLEEQSEACRHALDRAAGVTHLSAGSELSGQPGAFCCISSLI